MRKKNEKLWEHLKQNIQDFEIKAGWFEESKYDDGTPVGKVAAVQNFGAEINQTVTDKQRAFLHYIGIHLKDATKELNIVIPPRPFMDNAKKRIQGQEGKKILFQEMLRVFSGRQTMDMTTKRIALWMEGIIKEEIKAMNSPALAPSTIEARQREYQSKSKKQNKKPLNASGVMFNSVQSQVTKK